jgi:phosphoglycolate phosphatase
LENYREHHERTMMDGTVELPGARELLECLTASGRRSAICSNKPAGFSAMIVHHLGLAEHFGAIIGPEHVARPKPAPDMLNRAAAQLGTSPQKITYIGDMSIDIEAGRNARMTTWVVSTGSESAARLRKANPDRIFADLREVRAAMGFEAQPRN